MKQQITLDPTRSTAFGFWRCSRDYLRAATVVDGANRGWAYYPSLYLYGLSIELALKAFLLKRGAPLDKVRDYSHRLGKLIKDARRRKIGREVVITARDVVVVRVLSYAYESHELRYVMTGGGVSVPQMHDVSSVAKRLVQGLGPYCTDKARGSNKTAY